MTGVADDLARWCESNLGAAPTREIFRRSHLSEVIGVELADERLVVIKIRPPSPRLAAVTTIQRHLHASGFPCPDVLAGPTPFGSRTATAETYIRPHGDPPKHVPPRATADLLARLVDAAPPPDAYSALNPAPPWVGWDHDSNELWPWPDDLDIDLNDHDGPDWIDDTARRVRDRLSSTAARSVIGHIDWEANNLDWDGDQPVVAHDWDSLAIRPEPTIAGAAAATFASNGLTAVAATLDQTAAFLDAYSHHRNWTTTDHELAWCAGLWVLTYNAKKETLGGGSGYLERIQPEITQRRSLAGLQ